MSFDKNSFGEWLWDAETEHFEFRAGPHSPILGKESTFSSISDFVAVLTNDNKEKLVSCCEKVHKTGEIESFTCSLLLPEQPTVYCLIELERITAKQLKASLALLLQIPSNQKFSSIFDALFDNSHHGIVVCDARTRIVSANKYVERATGYQLSELIGQPTSIFNAGKHNRKFFKELWLEIQNNGYWSGNLLSRKKTGEVFPQEFTIQKITTDNGEVFYVGFSLDLSERLYRIADRESGGIELLTQLPSEKVFKSTLSSLTKSPTGYRGPIVIAFSPQFDPDNQIQERKELSGALAKHDDHYMAGYFGNNIFALSIGAFDCSSANVVHLIGAKIQEIFGRIKIKTGASLFKCITRGKIGVSIFGVDTDNPKLLVPHAMQAMLVHPSGKARSVNFYDAKLHDSLKRREYLENTVRNSIFGKTLDVHFQAIVSTADWKIAKFESLCRFPKDGDLSFETQEMIRVTEELNLVNELDRSIAAKAINHLPEIQDIFGAHVAISTNFSLCTQTPIHEVMQGIDDLIRQSGIGSEHITIELTESAYFGSGQSEASSHPLMKLRNNGVSIAIDDFGTGYSSFAYLTGKNFDFLKIDREFVSNLKLASREYYIVKMIVELAHILGVKVIAEGVEQLSEIKILTELKVDYLQGFYFSRPVPIDKIMQANAYLEHIEDLKPYSVVSGEAANLSSLVNRNVPKLEPSLSFSYLKGVFEHSDTEAVAVIDGNNCVGVIDKEIYYLHGSPTLGTDIEKRSDLEILRRRLVQIMRPPLHMVNINSPVSKTLSWLKEKKPFPWVVVDNNEHYVGLIGKGDVIKFFSSQYIAID
ncbi:EAL domain-containing protein [Neiella marina]|uniref:EAL domain-containing protein n=1 Tax=Neiella holothuriorum TaxID=2870530 RepID=A0ABS7EIG0_9GAMM|nr:EAL domain-containing protein [Neiella holothuriorum]MBW8192138.1 EAL domain-containing protein [Neiella holothuriorum]